MSKADKLEFEAIKYKYQEDEDGQATLILRVDMQNKLSAFAIPAKERLWVKIKILK